MIGLDLIILLSTPVIIAYQYIQAYSYDSDATGVYISRKIGRKCSPLNLFLIALIETKEGILGQSDYVKMIRPSLHFWMLSPEGFFLCSDLAALGR